MNQPLKKRWLFVPLWFASVLFASLLIRWWPLAASRAHDAHGIGTVIAGDLLLAWKSILRAIVALILIGIFWSHLPSLRRFQAALIGILFVVAEVAAEFTAAAFFGINATLWYQLLCTSVALLVVGGPSVWFLRQSAESRMVV
jgi:hypothetical protein